MPDTHAPPDDTAPTTDQLRERLADCAVDAVTVEADVAIVHADDFEGTHPIRTDPDGTTFVVEDGTYLHVPSDVHVEARCPDATRLREAVRTARRTEDRGAAARAAYRRDRL